jgi:DNA-binding transcriptional MocR family regulator
MSSGKNYKGKKKGGQKFVQLMEWQLASPAWRSLTPTARALYVELKRRYNRSNNGDITLSHREAAKALNLHRNTVGKYYKELQGAGFIEETEGYCLGPSGVGETSKWLLTELPSKDMRPAKRTFMRQQENQKPRTKSVQVRHISRDDEP